MSSKGQSLAGNWIGGCGVEMSPWAASSTTKSRLGSTSTRSRFQVCIGSDGDRSRIAMLVYLWLVCIMLSVVYLHGTYPPSRLWGLSELRFRT